MAILVAQYKAKDRKDYGKNRDLGKMFKEHNIKPEDEICHTTFSISTTDGKILREIIPFSIYTVEQQKKALYEIWDLGTLISKDKLKMFTIPLPFFFLPNQVWDNLGKWFSGKK